MKKVDQSSDFLKEARTASYMWKSKWEKKELFSGHFVTFCLVLFVAEKDKCLVIMFIENELSFLISCWCSLPRPTSFLPLI